MSTPELITLGLGIVISMIYGERTGLGSGGLVSAGLLALSLRAPMRVLACLIVAAALCPLLRFTVDHFGIHGRTRIGFAMLMVLAVRLAAGQFMQSVPWVGWVVPALIAADMQRQGILETLASVVSVTCLTGLLAQFLFQIGGALR